MLKLWISVGDYIVTYTVFLQVTESKHLSLVYLLYQSSKSSKSKVPIKAQMLSTIKIKASFAASAYLHIISRHKCSSQQTENYADYNQGKV